MSLPSVLSFLPACQQIIARQITARQVAAQWIAGSIALKKQKSREVCFKPHGLLSARGCLSGSRRPARGIANNDDYTKENYENGNNRCDTQSCHFLPTLFQLSVFVGVQCSQESTDLSSKKIGVSSARNRGYFGQMRTHTSHKVLIYLSGGCFRKMEAISLRHPTPAPSPSTP
jgi:hypothetical protein